MLEGLLRYSLSHRLAALIGAVVLVSIGYFSYRQLTIEAFPDPTDTQVQVISSYAGQPTEEVERHVSLPIERALNGIPGLFRLRSISLFGLSFVTLTFDDGVDPYLARQQVVERLTAVELPEGVHPELGPLATPIGEVYRYTLEGKGSDPMILRTLHDWTVRPQLMQVPGVADVVSYGGLVREVHIQPDPAKMAMLGVDLSAIFTALQKASDNATGGYLERGSEMFVIRSLGTFTSLSDLEGVRVGYHEGVPVLVRDVAAVTTGYAPRQGIVTRGDEEDAVQGIVLMRRGENPSVVLRALRERVDSLNGGILPDGVKIHAFYDRTELVNTTLATVFKNLAEGALLVVVVLFAFMLSLRASLIVAVAIPLSLASAFAYLHFRGMSANLLSMGAVDFGIIVDGAVILVEHLFHRLDPRHTSPEQAARSTTERIYDAAREVARPTLFSLLIIIAAYLPIFSLQRVEGRIFAPLAHTVVSALVGAMVVSFTVVPVLCSFALRKPKPQRESPLLRWAQRVFEPTIAFSMKNPAVVLIVAVGTLLSAGILTPRLGSEFLPQLNEGSLYVTFTLPDNLSISEGRKLTPRIRELIRRTPEAAGILTQLGRPEDGTDPKLPSNLEVFVRLKPLDEWRKTMRTVEDLTTEMAANLSEIPGIEYNFSQPIRDNVAENISGQVGQIAVKIFGEDLETLQRLSAEAKDAIAAVPGAADVGIVKSGESPQIAVKIDRAALARHDLDLGDVQDYIETAMGGHAASVFWEGERRFDVTVRLPVATREDIASIQRVMIPLKSGSLIPLSAVAEVTMGVGRSAITRENGHRYIGVRMNVRNRDLGSFVRDAQAAVTAKISAPAGYEMVWGGEFENQQRAMARLQIVIPLALLITFFLLFSAFSSVFDATVILVNVPFALVGGIFGLAATQMTLSVSAAVGFIALLGQAVLNGVLVVSAIRTRLDASEPLAQAIIAGTRDRLRAVLMTALLASLGLLPAAMSRAIGSETQRPIAVVIVAGTISAALLTLVVLPVTYFLACKARERLMPRRSA
jgi:cobalt-zinc-cadmium resistance protein CzcA